jgi:hypothetical protein
MVVGMFFRGAGIPAGATIGTVGTDYIVLANGVVATASATLVAVSAGYEILFQFPPIEDTGEVLTSNATVSESLSGVRQTSINYVGGVWKMKFSHLSPSLYTSVNAFLTSWAMLGNQFRYYDDQTLTSYFTVELDTLKVQPVKIAPVGLDLYAWEVPLDLRRAL